MVHPKDLTQVYQTVDASSLVCVAQLTCLRNYSDDGSSWYDIHDNFFFMADAWKMDYGGHDSRFTGNVI
eukprot:SAG31_NODE_38583_length_295_cov_0.780612_1_plen_68_part_01